jgi:hypothetical protein
VTLLASAAAVLAGHSLAGRYALPPGHLLALAAIIVAGLALAKDRAAAGAAVPAHPRLRRVAAIAAVVASIFTFSNFAFSVRLWDGFDVSLPFNMVAGPALLAGGILLLARRGGDGELFVVLGAGAMGLVGAAATWIMFPPSGAAVLAPCLAVTVLAAVVFIREKGLNPSGWIARPFDA